MVKLQSLATDIADAIFTDLGCPVVPHRSDFRNDQEWGTKVHQFIEQSVQIRQDAKDYHDNTRFIEPGFQIRRHTNSNDNPLYVEMGQLKFSIPGALVEEYQKAYCELTGELPFQASWAKILMFSGHEFERSIDDGTRISYFYRLTESSGDDLGYDDDGNRIEMAAVAA